MLFNAALVWMAFLSSSEIIQQWCWKSVCFLLLNTPKYTTIVLAFCLRKLETWINKWTMALLFSVLGKQYITTPQVQGPWLCYPYSQIQGLCVGLPCILLHASITWLVRWGDSSKSLACGGQCWSWDSPSSSLPWLFSQLESASDNQEWWWHLILATDHWSTLVLVSATSTGPDKTLWLGA